MPDELTPQQAAAVTRFLEELSAHDNCQQEQVGPCVYCRDHGVRLYQGRLPDSKRTTPKCAPDEHDWDMEMGLGFYSQCRTCGFTEWNE